MNLKCVDCNGAMEARVLDKLPQLCSDGTIAVVEGVPVEECSNCGQRYYSMDVIRLLSRIRDGKVPSTGTVEIKRFSLAG